MPLPPDLKVTSEMLWRATLLLALLDAVVVPLLARSISPSRFRELKWSVVVTAAVFWTLLWTWVLDWGWEPVYRYVFADWMRAWIPFVQGLHFAIVALVFWWGALRLARNPVAGFLLFGGLWGMVTHLWAVYWGIVDKPPMLQGAAPAAAVVIAIVEFMFYWCIILGVAQVLQKLVPSRARLASLR